MYKSLILAEKTNYAGGLLRFLKLSRCSLSYNNKFFFSVSDKNKSYNKDFLSTDLIEYHEINLFKWDFIILPGSGFSEHLIQIIKNLNTSTHVPKIQCILSNTSRIEKHLEFNRYFKPDILLVNNKNGWNKNSLKNFEYKSLSFVIGGVDTNVFCPSHLDLPFHRSYKCNEIKIGGQAYKDPSALIESLQHLAPKYILLLYGEFDSSLKEKYSTLIEQKRLFFLGPLSFEELSSYYNKLDIYVRTEQGGGWANSVAESFAASIPTITTVAGCEEFAVPGRNCIVIEKVTPKLISESIIKLTIDSKFRRTIISNSRNDIFPFSWNKVYFETFRKYTENKYFDWYEIKKRYKVFECFSKYNSKNLYFILFGSRSESVIKALKVNGYSNIYVINTNFLIMVNSAILFIKEYFQKSSSTKKHIFLILLFRYKFFVLKKIYNIPINLSNKLNIFNIKSETPKYSNYKFISFPKSGRSVIRYNLLLLGIENEITFSHDGFPYSGFEHDDHNFSVQNRILKYNQADKLVLLMRNPLKVICSLFSQINGRFVDYYDIDMSLSTFLRDQYFGINQIVRFYKVWEEYSKQKNIFILKFENYLVNKEEFMISLINYYGLGIGENTIKDTIADTELKRMKCYESLDYFHKPWLKPKNGFSKFRLSSNREDNIIFSQSDLDYIKDVYIANDFKY